MISSRAPTSPAWPLQGRAWALPLLVMAVLCGLLSMHGLAVTPPSEAQEHRVTPHSTHAQADAHEHAQVHAHERGRDHGDSHGLESRPASGSPQADDCECAGGDGHLAHADATCAATGTSGAPAMDGPAASTAIGPRSATGFEGCWSRTGGERAPPSLHRLQLLRI